jgi:nudix-type nucleoside diphosphatase (YffH/AdpP family)
MGEGPRIEELRRVHEGWTCLLVARIRGDGKTYDREIEDHGDAVAVLPYDPARRVALLVRQLRAPVLHAAGLPSLVEAPAGQLDEDEPEACARREAEEEVGLKLGALEPVGRFFSMPGISTERMSLYLAPYSARDRIAEGGGVTDANEHIEVVEMPLAELASELALDNADLKTLALVQALQLRRPELFL